jgi:hypothetical protein
LTVTLKAPLGGLGGKIWTFETSCLHPHSIEVNIITL